MALSPNNKFVAYKDNSCLSRRNEFKVEVFELPSLSMVFNLQMRNLNSPSNFLIFSPDSSYLLRNSVRSCISLREQKEVPLIPHGPESVDCCSFSSCGMKLVSCEKNLLKVWDVKKKSLLVQVETKVEVEYCLFSDCNSYILAWPVRQLHEFEFDDAAMYPFDFNGVVILESTTLERIDIAQISCADACLTDEGCYQIISPSYYDVPMPNTEFEIRHVHLQSGGVFLIANRHCSKPFTWKDRKCVIFWNSKYYSFLVYDFINKEPVELLPFNCLLRNIYVNWISKLDETNLFVCLCHNEVYVLELEPSTNSSVAPFASGSDTKCYALSPDNLYLACCNEDRNLTIRSVDSGETMQTVVLKQSPESCWWSELYLWVVCKGVVVKYPYDSTRTKVLGNYLEECAINFKSVLKFAEGVLVIRLSDNGEISILKICNQKIYPQQIPNSSFTATSVAISSDGCAVLLYRKSCSDYQLWEIACEYTWEVRSTGKLDDSYWVSWFCLTGTENSRSSTWLSSVEVDSSEDWSQRICIWSIDLPSCKERFVADLPFPNFLRGVIYVDSDILIIHQDDWICLINVSVGKIIASLYVDEIPDFQNVSSFYIPSRGILVLAGSRHTKFFKIHNTESNLPLLKKV